MPFFNQRNRFYPIPSELRFCSGSALKLVAVITMLIDHFGAGFVYAQMKTGIYPIDTDPIHLIEFYRLLRSIGRVAFPIFCFLVVEGLLHTHSKWRYLLRMTAFAFISELPFDLAVSTDFGADNLSANSLNIPQALAASRSKVLAQQNVFFTLAIGLAVIICMDLFFQSAEKISRYYLEKTRKRISEAAQKNNQDDQSTQALGTRKEYASSYGLASSPAYTALTVTLYLLAMTLSFAVLYAACIAANIIGTDYKWVGVMLIAVLYLLRKNVPMAAVISYVFLSNFMPNEIWAFPGFILMALYNEKRGFIKGRAAQYFFYAFYPLHLFLVYLLRVMLL